MAGWFHYTENITLSEIQPKRAVTGVTVNSAANQLF